MSETEATPLARQVSVAFGLSALLFLVGLWAGEKNIFIRSFFFFVERGALLLLAMATIAVIVYGLRKRRANLMFTAAMSFGFLLAGFLGGQLSYRIATSDCRDTLYAVHRAVEQYQDKHGKEPESMSDLDLPRDGFFANLFHQVGVYEGEYGTLRSRRILRAPLVKLERGYGGKLSMTCRTGFGGYFVDDKGIVQWSK